MVLQLLDVIPISPVEYQQREEARERAKLEKQQQQEKSLEEKSLKEKKKAEKKAAKTEKKAVKAEKKAEKLEKKAAKAKKNAVEARKKATEAKEKAESQTLKSEKDLSVASVPSVATIQIPEGIDYGSACEAAMPTGVVLAVCASLLVCFGSAWFYRRFHSFTPTF